MNTKNLVKIGPVSVSCMVCTLLLLSACATSTHTESSIEDRANARWAALLSGDLAGAYEFLSPGYRSSVSSLQYQRSILLKKVAWKSADYIESACEETTCKVKMNVGFSVYGAVPGVKSYNGTQKVEESWILVDGQWYFVPKK